MALCVTFRWLAALCDPQINRDSHLLFVPEPSQPMTPAQLSRLMELATRHGVLPAVLANLRRISEARGPAAIVRADDAGTLATAMAQGDQVMLKRTAMAMLLRWQLAQIGRALAARGLPGIVIKGPDAAARLYENVSLRPFTDIDLLTDVSAAAQLDAALRDIGYEPKSPDMKYAEGYGELAYRRSDAAGGAVEVHWNLVNSPMLRKGLSVELGDLQLEPAPITSCQWTGRQPSAASLLLIAAVHAAASHGFDRLQHLCDIRQVIRGRAGEIDRDYLKDAVAKTGAGLALATALDLTRRTLETGEAMDGRSGEDLIRDLGLSRPGAAMRKLLTPGMVLRCHAKADSFRRQIFRGMLKRSRRCVATSTVATAPGRTVTTPTGRDGGRS